jgi:DNA (cytosine-5)-methyltransferase 1
MSLVFGSVCSGIEAASVAWTPLGWKSAFLSEIESFPRAVLQHHYPEVPLHGDFTTIRAGEYDPIDLLVGGTPCQSFSVAGLRGGLDDHRGNLALEYLRLADRLRPRWLVWENVPGVLSSNGGRDFGSILGGLVELGYGFAYRVLDAQFFGVAQRRRRVFVVGHLGDWRRAAAVLFERHSLQGHPAPRREAREGVAADVAHSLRAGGFDASEDGTGRGTPLVAGTLSANGKAAGSATQQDAESGMLIAFALRGREGGALPENSGDRVGSLRSASGGSSRDYIAGTVRSHTRPGSNEIGSIVHTSAVRRLTPRECERLQGFPNDYTLIPWRKGMAPDGLRYKALGNSMAVPVMAWIGRRIEAVEAIAAQQAAA